MESVVVVPVKAPPSQCAESQETLAVSEPRDTTAMLTLYIMILRLSPDAQSEAESEKEAERVSHDRLAKHGQRTPNLGSAHTP